MKRILFILLGSFFIVSQGFAQLDSTPDTFETEGGDLTVYPINHGTVAFTYNDLTIFVDPFGGAERFADFNAPDIIFITDIHGDHLNPETLGGLDTENTRFVVPPAVAERMDENMSDQITIISNGETADIQGLSVAAVPMYNLPEVGSRHTKGRGNGYVIDFADTRLYLSGDTEDIPEMRALEDIDIAFVCMNLPYTMDIYQAASAVVEFQPDVMYPYHHRGQDIEKFKQVVELAEIETDVRLKNWYPN
jgi:L-ascorbate metabolism protein UlaG (beta-lactamase superfamily)